MRRLQPIAALLLAGGLYAQPPAFDADKCVASIEATQKKLHIPGISVAVLREGKVIFARGFGKADLENDVPVTKRTVFRLASISKPVTAVAVLQLLERKKLDLDKPVQDYVTTLPQKKWPLTSRHLLSHLGGVRHYRGRETLSARRYPSVEVALAIFARDPLLFEPGTRHRYTTYGYNILGAVVARVADQRFEDYLQANVFQPAGMTQAQADDSQRLIRHRAQGYRRTRAGHYLNSALVDTSNKIPGGGLCSTPTDLVLFADALATGRLLQPETTKQMWTRARLRDGKAVNYGMGFRVWGTPDDLTVGHSGAQPRVRTVLLLRPRERVAVAAMCNLEGVSLGGLAFGILEQVLGRQVPRRARAAASRPTSRPSSQPTSRPVRRQP